MFSLLYHNRVVCNYKDPVALRHSNKNEQKMYIPIISVTKHFFWQKWVQKILSRYISFLLYSTIYFRVSPPLLLIFFSLKSVCVRAFIQCYMTMTKKKIETGYVVRWKYKMLVNTNNIKPFCCLFSFLLLSFQYTPTKRHV